MSFLGSNPRQSTIDGAVMTSVVYVKYWNKHLPTFKFADVVKLADTRDLGSRVERRAGSSPVIRT